VRKQKMVSQHFIWVNKNNEKYFLIEYTSYFSCSR
jgi:hypothetical protein